jgi:response regulator RpfG family c-di-GMP phosphodiesterase
LSGAELTQVHLILSAREMDLWGKYQNVDQRHSIVVLNRLNVLMPTAGREAQAAALLHDIGKSRSQLGVLLRVVATIVGPRTRRFSQYHCHEEIGIELLESIGSSDVMISLLKGVGDPQVIAALTAADNI